MDGFAREVGILHGEQHGVPALMEAVEDLNRHARIERHVGELRPFGFVVRLDRGFVFSQRQPKTNKRVHMTVGEMVHDLAGRPPAVSIRLIEARAGHRGLELARQTGNGVNTVASPAGGAGLIEAEFPGGKTCIHAQDDSLSH
jgi:hypothetical protein